MLETKTGQEVIDLFRKPAGLPQLLDMAVLGSGLPDDLGVT